MRRSTSHRHPAEPVVAQPFPHGDVLSTLGFDADGGLTQVFDAAFVEPLAFLTPSEFAAVVANRAVIEQAVGVLASVYDLDLDNAVELLKWGSRARRIAVPLCATQLMEACEARVRDGDGHERNADVDLRSACDDVLFSAAESDTPESLAVIEDPGTDATVSSVRRFDVRPPSGAVVVLAVRGELDASTAPLVSEAISSGLVEPPTALIVDLSELDFLTAAGMTVLVNGRHAAGESTRFGVVADGPGTSRPMKLIGLDRELSLYATLDSALKDLLRPS